MRVSSLVVYPLKSAAGIALDEARVVQHGFEFDRRWMLVDDAGKFLSQRTVPRMALLTPMIDVTNGALCIKAPGMPLLRLSLYPQGVADTPVVVWDDMVMALSIQHAGQWFRDFLGVSCKLVYMPDTSFRVVDQAFARLTDRVGFADGFPFLLISEASLEDLNARLDAPLPMNRFRPNLVAQGTHAFAEDTWRSIRVGTVSFEVVKPCARCVMTTVNQQTAQTAKEPLKTLATYRKRNNDVMFGQNLIHNEQGVIRVGDAITVLETQDPIF